MRRIVHPLLSWYEKNRRDLPWRRDREPYHVWLSEIMLQQTRVEAVRGYYARFLRELPDIAALAACEPERLNKLWEGLGYYSRVRNLQKAAGRIMAQHGGSFPRDYADVRALPGIGDYTAGAICSICFEQPTPAVDGNVLRVLSRLLNDFSPVTDERVKREYRETLAAIYPAGHCGDFTQALMELGATVCVPNGAPRCDLCPLRAQCLAFARETVMELPVKAPKKEKRVEEKTVFVLECDGCIAVRKRPAKGLLAGLWEFPNTDGHLTAQEAIEQAEGWDCSPAELLKSVEREHVFTHVRWKLRGFYLTCRRKSALFVWADAERLARSVALPSAFRQFSEQP